MCMPLDKKRREQLQKFVSEFYLVVSSRTYNRIDAEQKKKRKMKLSPIFLYLLHFCALSNTRQRTICKLAQWNSLLKHLSQIFPGNQNSVSSLNKKLFLQIIFSILSYNCSNALNLRNFQEQVKKVFCFKYFTDFSLFDQGISKVQQILRLQPQISNVYPKNNFFLQYNFRNKIPV